MAWASHPRFAAEAQSYRRASDREDAWVEPRKSSCEWGPLLNSASVGWRQLRAKPCIGDIERRLAFAELLQRRALGGFDEIGDHLARPPIGRLGVLWFCWFDAIEFGDVRCPLREILTAPYLVLERACNLREEGTVSVQLASLCQ